MGLQRGYSSYLVKKALCQSQTLQKMAAKLLGKMVVYVQSGVSFCCFSCLYYSLPWAKKSECYPLQIWYPVVELEFVPFHI